MRKKYLPEAITIKINEGITYADTLRKLKADVDPKSAGAEISVVRRTRSGDILVEFKKGTDTENFKKAVETAMEGKGSVKSLQKLYPLEIRDLDGSITKDDLIEAVKNTTGDSSLNVRIYSLREGIRGMQIAVIGVPANATDQLLKKGKIEVGWVKCRIREKTIVQQCYKCLGYGHKAVNCKGISREGLCWNCSKTGHKSRNCQNESFCIICHEAKEKDTGHKLGSLKCPAYIEELKKRKEDDKIFAN